MMRKKKKRYKAGLITGRPRTTRRSLVLRRTVDGPPESEVIDFMRGIGASICFIRERRGISIADLSLRMGLGSSTQSRRENGESFPVQDLYLYAHVLSVSMAVLMGDKACRGSSVVQAV